VIVLVLAIFLVGAQEGLFQRMFHVSTYFDVVQGIRSGSAVRLAGVDIGVVDRVEVSPLNNKVRLYLKVNTRVMGFLKKDSYATIEPEGLVGNYFVGLTVGSPRSEEISDGDVIQSREPVRLAVVLEDVQAVVANVRRATEELSSTLSSVNKGQGTLGQLITNDRVYRNMEHATAQADTGVGKAVEELSAVSHAISGLSGTIGDFANKADTVATEVNGMVSKLSRGEGTIGALLTERTLYDSLLFVVHNTIALTEEAKAGARKFDEDMEALKHNFLFKGYFEDRGYWDKADYEKRIDEKIEKLKTLERTIARETEELNIREGRMQK